MSVTKHFAPLHTQGALNQTPKQTNGHESHSRPHHPTSNKTMVNWGVKPLSFSVPKTLHDHEAQTHQ